MIVDSCEHEWEYVLDGVQETGTPTWCGEPVSSGAPSAGAGGSSTQTIFPGSG